MLGLGVEINHFNFKKLLQTHYSICDLPACTLNRLACPLVALSGRRARPPSAAPQANAGRAQLAGELAMAGGAKRTNLKWK